MRVLVYAMQSSGATAFSLFLAQRPGSLGLVDILNNYAAPHVETSHDIIAKAVVTTAYPLAVHQQRFLPDRSILLLRDPRDNYESLRRKNYRNHSGLIDEKFALLDEVFRARDAFDAVIEYEDFIARAPHVLTTMQRLGWPVDESYYDFRRSHTELMDALWEAVPDLFERFEFSYGNVQAKEVSPRFAKKTWSEGLEAHLASLCPDLLDHYHRRDESAAISASNALQTG